MEEDDLRRLLKSKINNVKSRSMKCKQYKNIEYKEITIGGKQLCNKSMK